MFRERITFGVGLVALALCLLVVAPAMPQVQKADKVPAKAASPAPEPKPVAAVGAIMRGINRPNFSWLEYQLQRQPRDADTWGRVEDEALVLTEAGNLLMMRPPRSGEARAWLDRADGLRNAGIALAQAAQARNFDRCRNNLIRLSDACNRCHTTFRVNVQITAFANQQPGGPGAPRPPLVPAPPDLPQLPPVPEPPPVPPPPT
jgi:hypothetical protein